MERKSKKVTAFLLAFLMILSVCLPSAGSLGLNRVNAEAEAGYEETAGKDILNATGGDASTEAAQEPTEAEYITTGNALSGMPAPIANEGTPMPIADGNSGLTVNNFHVKVNGKEIESGETVQNGATFEVSFDWSIKNNTGVKDFQVDLQGQNLSIDNYDEAELRDVNGNIVGYYKIEDGIVYFHLSDEFASKSDIDGGGNLVGKVNAGRSGDSPIEEKEFKIGDATYTVNVDFGDESRINAYKRTAGSAYLNEDGELCQKFEVTLDTSWSGEATLNSITDTATGFLTDSVKDLNIQFPDGSEKQFDDWDKLNAYLNENDVKLKNDQKIVITYEMTVEDLQDAMSNTSSKPLQNKITANYTNNKNENKDSSSETFANIKKPSIGKNGSVVVDDGETYVEWTVTIDPGLFDWTDLQSVKDTLGKYLSPDSSLDLTNLKDKFVEQDNGTYKFKYKTKVDDGIIGTPFTHSVDNHVEMEFLFDDKTYTYDTSATVGIDPTDLLTKTATGDNGKNIVYWEIKIHIPEDGDMTNVRLKESPEYRLHISNVTVNETLVYDGTIKESEIISDAKFDKWDSYLDFTDDFIDKQKGKDITIKIATTLDDGNFPDYNVKYQNTAEFSFEYDNEPGKQTETADYDYVPNEKIFTKSGSESTDYRTAIDYTLDFDLLKLELKEGDTITITDILPENMHLAGEPKYYLQKGHKGWNESEEEFNNDEKNQMEYEYDENAMELKFNYTINSTFLEKIKTVVDSTSDLEKYHLIIKYTAQVNPEYIKENMLDGQECTFHNEASLSHNNTPLASAEADVPLKYGSLTTKYGEYPQGSESVVYTVIVNPDKLKLSDNGYLTGIDESGNALLLQNNSISFEKYIGKKNPINDKESGNWVTCTDAKYTYNQAQHKIIFTLPDETAIKITYKMDINLHYDGSKNNDSWTDENSFNKFSLSGYSSERHVSSKNWQGMVQTPTFWSNNAYDSIKIYKFWTKDGQMVALPGSKFTLYDCSWTKTDITIKTDTPVKTDITVDSKGETTIDGLALDKIYALVETEAAPGFNCNTKPYYFALSSKRSTEISDTFPDNVELFFSSAHLYYENFPSQAKLVLKKTLASDDSTVDIGELKEAVLKQDITFTLENTNDPTDVKEYKLNSKDFTYDEATHEFTLEDDIAAGTYTVTETATAPDGYVLESTTYTVTVTPGTGMDTTLNGETTETGSFTVQDGDTATVAFTNTYKKAAGKLVLKKTLAADGTVDLAKLKDAVLAKNITFTLENKDDPSDVKEYKLNSKDFTYDEATHEFTLETGIAAGTYSVTETATAPDGYVLKSTTYTVTVTPETGAASTLSGKTTETDEFEVKDGDTATVAFTNTYKKATGKLVIQKTIKGAVTEDEAEGALQFTVKKEDGTEVGTYKLSDFEHVDGTKEYTLTLDNLDEGDYIITETVTDVTGKVLESVTYSLNGSALKDITKNPTVTAEVTAGSSTTVVFEDNYINEDTAGKLIIQKTIEGSVTKEEAEGALEFTVKNETTGEEKIYHLKDFDYDAKTGIFTRELDVEAGEYTVTESVRDVDGHVLKSVSYTVSGSSAETKTDPGSVGVKVEEQGEVTVVFKDAYEKATGKLVLKKTIKGSVTKEEAEGALTFTVTDETGKSTDYTLKDFKYDEKSGEFTLELTEEVGVYTVTESVKDIEGYILQSVTYTLYNGTETNGDSVKAEVKQDKTTTVVFKDDYIEEDKTGTLVLKKTIKGAITKEEAEGALEFTVKNNTTKEEKTYTLKDFKYDEKTGEYTLTLPLEEGGYTVTESTKDVDGYVLDSVTYTVNGGDVTKGDSVTTDVKAKETVMVTFEDDYSKSQTESSSEQKTETTTEITTEVTTETTTETTIITTENVTETETQTSAKSEVKTGDKAPIILVCILLLVSAAAGGIVIGKKMKNKKDQ